MKKLKAKDLYESELGQYYSGTQTTVFINNQYVEEAVAIGWNAVVNSSPMYSYNEELYNNIAKGVFRVEGKIILNFKAAGYLQYLLLKGDKQIGNKNNAGIVPFALSHNGKHYNENDRGDIVFDESKRRIEKYQFDKSSAGLSNAEYFDLKNNMKDYIWGNSNSDINGDTSPNAIRNALHDTTFDILIIYGNPNSDNYTIHTIVDAMILNVSQDVANDGTPVYEVYQFLARDIDQPLFNEADKRNFELYNGSSIYKPSMNEALSTLQTLMKNNLMDNIINPWKNYVHVGDDHVKIQFDKQTTLFGDKKFVFDSDSSVYNEALPLGAKTTNKTIMDSVAALMKNDKAVKILIEGHTDCAAGDAYNLTLSIARAKAIEAELKNNHGILENRISAVGYGETQPITDNLCDGEHYSGYPGDITEAKRAAEVNRRTVVKTFATMNLKPDKNNSYNLPFVDELNDYISLTTLELTSFIDNMYKVSLNLKQPEPQLVQAHYSQNDYNGMQYKPTAADTDYKIYPIAYTKKEDGSYIIDHGQDKKSSRELLATMAGISEDEMNIRPYIDVDFMGPIDYDKVSNCDLGNTIHTVEIKEHTLSGAVLNSETNMYYSEPANTILFDTNEKEVKYVNDIEYNYIQSTSTQLTNSPYTDFTYIAAKKNEVNDGAGILFTKASIVSEIDFSKITNFDKMIGLNSVDVITDKKVDFSKQTPDAAKRLNSDITLITTAPDYEKTKNNIIKNINAYVKELITLTDYFGQVNTISLFDIIIEAPNNTNIVNNINARLDTIVKPYVNIASAQSSELIGTVQFKPTKKFSSIYNEISMLENNKATITTNYSSVISLDSYSNYMAIICNDDVNEVNTTVDNTIQKIIGAFAPLYSDINNNITGTTINTKYFNIQQVSNYYKNNTTLPTKERFVNFKITLTGTEVKVVNEVKGTNNKYSKKSTLEEQLDADVISSNALYTLDESNSKKLLVFPISKPSVNKHKHKYATAEIQTMYDQSTSETHKFELLNSMNDQCYLAMTTTDNITKYIMNTIKQKQKIYLFVANYVVPKLVDKNLSITDIFVEVEENMNITRMPILVLDFPTGTEYENFRTADLLLGKWNLYNKNEIHCKFDGVDKVLTAQNTRIVRDDKYLYIIIDSDVLLNTTTGKYEIPDNISNFKLYYGKETTLDIDDSKKLSLQRSVVPGTIDGKKDKDDTTINYLFGNSLINDANYVYNKDGTFNTKSKTNYNLNDFVPSYNLYLRNSTEVSTVLPSTIPTMPGKHFESLHLPFKAAVPNGIINYAGSYVFLDDQPGVSTGDTKAIAIGTIITPTENMNKALKQTNIQVNDPPYVMHSYLYACYDRIITTPYDPTIINIDISEVSKINKLNQKAQYFTLKDNSYNKMKKAAGNIIPSFRAVMNFDNIEKHIRADYKEELEALNISDSTLSELLLEFTYQAYIDYDPQTSEYVDAAMPNHNKIKIDCNKQETEKDKKKCKALNELPGMEKYNILLLEGLVSQGKYSWLPQKLNKNGNNTLYAKLDAILNNN